MDFQTLRSSPLPRKDQALDEYINVVPDKCMAIEDHLENRNSQLQPLHVREIIKRKLEDAEENLKPNCFLKIASRMRDDTFLVHEFLMGPKLDTCTRKILQMELQIPRGLKWPVQDVSSVTDVELTMLRPSKIPASLLLAAQPKMSPLLQPSQSTGAIPSSGSVHQQPNGTCQDGGLQCLEELGAKYKGEEATMSSEAPELEAPVPPSGPLRFAPPGEGRRRNEPYPQPYSPRPNKKGISSSGGAAGEGTSGSGTQGGGAGPSGSGPPGATGEAGGPSDVPEDGATTCSCCCII